ncbi:type II secretion system protein GspJ [Kiritimatiellaeota bacterium B1221]|nr:type II secretion system protein GspJ [Kiritimatiellaeota bacterium B1221]
MKSKQAFTLLEIIMTLALSALLLGAVSTFFAGATHLRDGGTARMEILPARERTLSLLRSDISQLMLAGNELAGVLIGDPQGEDSNFPGSLSLTTTSYRPHGISDMIEVEYRMLEDDDEDASAGMLVREVNPHLLAVQEQDPETEVLLRGVDAMEFGFWDGDQWLDSWDADHQTNAPPAVVRVKIFFSDSEQLLNDAIEVVVPVMAGPLTRETDEESSE